MNEFARLLSIILGLGAALFLIVTLIGLLGAVDGSYDLVNHFRLVFVLPGLVLAALALLLRSRTAAIVAALALAIQGVSLAPEVYAALTPLPDNADKRHLTVVTFNTQHWHVDPRRLRRFIESERPDVLVVQEAWGDGAKAVRALADLLPHAVECMDVRGCNLAILSRHPIAAQTLRPQSRDGGAAGSPMRYAVAELAIAGPSGAPIPVTIVNTHLSWPVPHERQARQFRRLADIVSAAGNERTILAGDFNSTPWSFAMHRFDAAVPLDRITRALPSWPASLTVGGAEIPYPLLPIDHILVGAKIAPVSVRRGPHLGSDHYPVIAEVALAE